MGRDPKKLKEPIEQLQASASDAGRPALEVKLMTALPLEDSERALDHVHALREVGVTSLIHGVRYTAFDQFEEAAGRLAQCRHAF